MNPLGGNMVNITLKNGYRIQSLALAELNTIELLNLKCSDYYMLHDGVLPSKNEALEIFYSLPPGKNYEDKFSLGIYQDENELKGVIEVVRDFPVNGEWMLGLLLIEPETRNNGLGKLIHEALVQWAITLGSESFRIGVIEDNHKGQNFWSDLGYIKIMEVAVNKPLKTHIVNVMTYQCN